MSEHIKEFKEQLVGEGKPFTAGWFKKENPQAEYLFGCSVYPTEETLVKFDSNRKKLGLPKFMEQYTRQQHSRKYACDMGDLGIDIKSHFNTVAYNIATFCYIPDDLKSSKQGGFEFGFIQSKDNMPFYQGYGQYVTSLLPFVYQGDRTEMLGFSLIFSPAMLHILIEDMISEGVLDSNDFFVNNRYCFDNDVLSAVLKGTIASSGCDSFFEERGVELLTDERIRFYIIPNGLIQMNEEIPMYIYAKEGFISPEQASDNPLEARYMFTMLTDVEWGNLYLSSVNEGTGYSLYSPMIECFPVTGGNLEEDDRYRHLVNTKKYVDAAKKLIDAKIDVTAVATRSLFEFGDIMQRPVFMEIKLDKPGVSSSGLGYLFYTTGYHFRRIADDCNCKGLEFTTSDISKLMLIMACKFFGRSIPPEFMADMAIDLGSVQFKTVDAGIDRPGHLYFVGYPEIENPCTISEVDVAEEIQIIFGSVMNVLDDLDKELELGGIDAIDSVGIYDGKVVCAPEDEYKNDEGLRFTFKIVDSGDSYELQIHNISLPLDKRNLGYFDIILGRVAMLCSKLGVRITFSETVNMTLANKLVLKYGGTLHDIPYNNERNITLNPKYVLQILEKETDNKP